VRVAALYDIHGNLPALEAVLDDVERAEVDVIVCGGDVAADPMPGECVARLRDAGARFVRGNADREQSAWLRAQLSDDERAFLAALPTTVVLADACFCHGTPRSDEEIVTRLTPDHVLAEILADVDQPLVVGGHVHVQYDRRCGRHRVVNAGSVGMPYEGIRGAFWALVADDVDLRRTEYDIEAAVARIRATGYPDREELAGWLLDPPDPGEVSAYFEGQARGA
jgi:putative phosphoesterase